jgi:hypothetical protein
MYKWWNTAGYNDQADAFKHTLWMGWTKSRLNSKARQITIYGKVRFKAGEMRVNTAEFWTRKIGDAHEADCYMAPTDNVTRRNRKCVREAQMDQYNNSVGRGMAYADAKLDDLVTGVFDRMKTRKIKMIVIRVGYNDANRPRQWGCRFTKPFDLPKALKGRWDRPRAKWDPTFAQANWHNARAKRTCDSIG